MENKPFNINEWLPVKIEDRRQKTEEGRPNADSQLLNADSRLPVPTPQATHNIEQDIELVTASLERAQYDLTADYNNWLQIGFGLANELGELGRSYFHRISRFNPKYTIVDTDKKYDSCLKNLRTGTTIKTFFYFAKQADIDINKQKKNSPGPVAATNEEDKDPDSYREGLGRPKKMIIALLCCPQKFSKICPGYLRIVVLFLLTVLKKISFYLAQLLF